MLCLLWKRDSQAIGHSCCTRNNVYKTTLKWVFTERWYSYLPRFMRYRKIQSIVVSKFPLDLFEREACVSIALLTIRKTI